MAFETSYLLLLSLIPQDLETFLSIFVEAVFFKIEIMSVKLLHFDTQLYVRNIIDERGYYSIKKLFLSEFYRSFLGKSYWNEQIFCWYYL